VYHFKAGECDYGSWGCPQKIGGTPTVKTRKALLLKDLSNAVCHTRVSLLWVVSLFLQSGSNDLQTRNKHFILSDACLLRA